MRNRSTVLTITFLVCFYGFSQRTIEVARLFVVNLYLEEEIKEVDLGDPLYFEVERYGERFSITVNPELAPTERTTNITMVAESGNVYTMILTIVEQPGKFNIPIKIEDAVIKRSTRTVPLPVTKNTIVTDPKHYYNRDTVPSATTPDSLSAEYKLPTEELYAMDKKAYFKKKIFYNKSGSPDVFRYFGRNGRVYLHLYSIKYNRNELYLFLNLDNKEGIDFDINTINASIGTNRKKKNTYQKIRMEPLYSYDVPERIEGGKEHLFALVFEKFALDRNKSFYLELDELNGDRNIILQIDHRTLSNPIRF